MGTQIDLIKSLYDYITIYIILNNQIGLPFPTTVLTHRQFSIIYKSIQYISRANNARHTRK